ncbi:hypothetical protein DSECCO2_431400 [anaerobic digester metagenome]
MDFIKNIWTDEEGQGLTEYALIIALVAVGLIAALGFLKDDIVNVFNAIGNALD